MTSIISLNRLLSTAEFTLGEFLFSGNRYYSCEDAIRKVKIPKLTCIPEGSYQVIIDYSYRFKKNMPLLLKVPEFTGIRIHSGNTADDTEGCILIGRRMLSNGVADSKDAYNEFFPLLRKRLNEGMVQIVIKNPPQVWEAIHESSKAADEG